MTVFELISKLSDTAQISGVEEVFPPLVSPLQTDSLGNAFCFIKGTSPNAKTVLFEAHRDEIGLCVAEILNGGFVKAVPCGGFDANVLPGHLFEIIGAERVFAIAASTPPHLSKLDKNNDKLKVQDLFFDTGYESSDELKKKISVGDPIIISAELAKMQDDKITGRSLDNKISVAALLMAAENLKAPVHNVVLLFSVGEETNSRGVRKICREIKPDFAVVLDAGFAYSEGMDQTRCITMGRGPSVSYTDTLSLSATKFLVKVAEENNIPLQKIAEPGGTGTSATAIQVEAGGIPVGVISIPVYNMHTAGEIACERDVALAAELICAVAKQKEIPQKEEMIL